MIHKNHEKHVFFHFLKVLLWGQKTKKNVCLPSKILNCMRIFHNTKIWVTVFNNRLPGELSNLGKSGTLKKNAHIYILKVGYTESFYQNDIYIYGHFFFKVPLFPKFESSPGCLLLNTVTQILLLWKLLIQYKILDGKHTFFSVFCPQSSTFKIRKNTCFSWFLWITF